MPALILGVLIVLLFALYLIIRSAINNSDAVRLLSEIRDMLKKWELERKAVDIPESEIKDSSEDI